MSIKVATPQKAVFIVHDDVDCESALRELRVCFINSLHPTAFQPQLSLTGDVCTILAGE